MYLNVITQPRDYELEDNWGFYIDIENMAQTSFDDNTYDVKPIYDNITSEKNEKNYKEKNYEKNEENEKNDVSDLMSHVNSTTIITAALSLSYLLFLIL
jgi:hypothetical protein